MRSEYISEKWKDIIFDDAISEKEKFKISNYGRILNCKGEEEFLVKEYYINGYQNLPIRQKVNGKMTSRYVHKLVAQHFLEQAVSGMLPKNKLRKSQLRRLHLVVGGAENPHTAQKPEPLPTNI